MRAVGSLAQLAAPGSLYWVPINPHVSYAVSGSFLWSLSAFSLQLAHLGVGLDLWSTHINTGNNSTYYSEIHIQRHKSSLKYVPMMWVGRRRGRMRYKRKTILKSIPKALHGLMNSLHFMSKRHPPHSPLGKKQMTRMTIMIRKTYLSKHKSKLVLPSFHHMEALGVLSQGSFLHKMIPQVLWVVLGIS